MAIDINEFLNLRALKQINVYAENKFNEPYKLKFAFFYVNNALELKEFLYDDIYKLYEDLFYFLYSQDLLEFKSTKELKDFYKYCDSDTNLFDIYVKSKENNFYNKANIDVYFGLNDIKCILNANYNNEELVFKEFVEKFIKKSKNTNVNFNISFIKSLFMEDDRHKRSLYRNIKQMLKDKQSGEDIYTKEQYNNLIYGLSDFEITYFKNPYDIEDIIKRSKKIILKTSLNQEENIFDFSKRNLDLESCYEIIIKKIFKELNKKRLLDNEKMTSLHDKKNNILIVYFYNIDEEDIKKISHIIKEIDNIE